jgi:hypothetical protein
VLDARAKTVKELLHSGDQYVIPFFQRSYSWNLKHWQRLVADVNALADTPPDRLHFLALPGFVWVGPTCCGRAHRSEP